MKRFRNAVKLMTVCALSLMVVFVLAGCGDDNDKAAAGNTAAPAPKTYEPDQKIGDAGRVKVDSKKKFDATQQAIVNRIAEFADATEDKDYKKICNDILTEESQKLGGNCVETLKKTGDSIKDFNITVKSIVVGEDGKTATATAVSKTNGQAGAEQSLTMLKDTKGKWRVAILGQ